MIKYSCVTAFYYQGTLSNHSGLVYYVVNHHFFSVLGSVLKPVDADFLTVEAAAFYFSTTNNSQTGLPVSATAHGISTLRFPPSHPQSGPGVLGGVAHDTARTHKDKPPTVFPISFNPDLSRELC